MESDIIEKYYVLKSGGEGDYARIRVSGMSLHLPRKEGMIRLERIAPFIPPMSLPGSDVIVTAEFLKMISQSEFTNWTTKPVFKHLIVHCEWDGNGEFAREYEYAEPEDVILWEQHNADLADKLGDLFELVLPIGCNAESISSARPHCMWKNVQYHSLSGGDLFCAQLPGGTVPMCSERFRSWIGSQPNVAKWVEFVPIQFQRVP